MRRASYDIYTVQVHFEHVDYYRPCIIHSDAEGGLSVWVIALSTKQLSEHSQSFKIDSSHPDFAATGLKETSYTVHPMRRVPKSRIGGKIGVLKGQLAKELLDALGL